MSWAIFKANILRYANNPNSLQDIDTVAKIWAREYDAAIKRGFDTVNLITIKRGNLEILEQLIKVALRKGLLSNQPYDLVGEMGNAVRAYWSGAIMNEIPIPLVPAVGATSNITVIANIVVNPGTWAPPLRIPDNTTTLGQVNLTQLEFPENVEMGQTEIDGAREDLVSAENDLLLFSQENLDEEAVTAEEQIWYQSERIQSEQNTSVYVDTDTLTDEQKKQIDDITNVNTTIDENYLGKLIVSNAIRDLGTLENPLPPNKPENSGKRVLEMLGNSGINRPAYWCAAAVTTWYKASGADYPESGSASCAAWMQWAKKNKLFSLTPTIGAAVLYGSNSHPNHIGIVETITGNKITTIEGNTSGAGFSRNGVGVFRKTPNPSRIIGFIQPRRK
jgi:hypothetical protein